MRAVASSSSASDGTSSHALASMLKIYVEDAQKYSFALTDSFEHKYKLFEERCGQCGLSEEDKIIAFSIMLCAIAHPCYFFYIQSLSSDTEKMLDKFNQGFRAEERYLGMTHQWDATCLSNKIMENPKLPKKVCLGKMMNNLKSNRFF